MRAHAISAIIAWLALSSLSYVAGIGVTFHSDVDYHGHATTHFFEGPEECVKREQIYAPFLVKSMRTHEVNGWCAVYLESTGCEGTRSIFGSAGVASMGRYAVDTPDKLLHNGIRGFGSMNCWIGANDNEKDRRW